MSWTKRHKVRPPTSHLAVCLSVHSTVSPSKSIDGWALKRDSICMTITEPNKARGPHPIRNNKQVSRESQTLSTLHLKRYKYEPWKLDRTIGWKGLKSCSLSGEANLQPFKLTASHLKCIIHFRIVWRVAGRDQDRMAELHYITRRIMQLVRKTSIFILPHRKQTEQINKHLWAKTHDSNNRHILFFSHFHFSQFFQIFHNF